MPESHKWAELLTRNVVGARCCRDVALLPRAMQRAKESKLMQLFTRPLAAAVLMLTWHLGVPAANAQAEAPAPGATDQKPDISEQKLDAMAAALEQVATVKDSYQQQIAAAPPPDKERIAAEAKNALVKAVTDQGLSVEEYTSILVVAQNDPQVREKILQRLRPTAK
jgi:hypothetical protein